MKSNIAYLRINSTFIYLKKKTLFTFPPFRRETEKKKTDPTSWSGFLRVRHKSFPSDVSWVYDSFIQHAQLNGNLTIVTFFCLFFFLTWFQIKNQVKQPFTRLFHSLTRTHTLTLEQETNFIINQPSLQMFYPPPPPPPSATFLLHKPTNFRKQSLNDQCSPVSMTHFDPKFGCWLASVSHPISTCSRTQIQTQDTANTHIYK